MATTIPDSIGTPATFTAEGRLPETGAPLGFNLLIGLGFIVLGWCALAVRYYAKGSK